MEKATLFADAVRPFVERARLPATDLVPILPPGCTLTENSNVRENDRGKVPGRYWSGSRSWSGMGGKEWPWAANGLSAQQVRTVGLWPTANVGLRTARFPAIDIDVNCPKVRDMIERAAVEHFGPAPIRERAGSPRSLMLFRLADKETEPVRKMHVKFVLDGQQHAIDILGAGQQCLISGTHPSGTEYGWRKDFELKVWGVDGLTPVTAKEVRDFYNYVIELVQQAGGTIGAANAARTGLDADGREGLAVADLDPVVTADTVRSILAKVQNTEAAFPSREDFVSFVAALRAALGRDSEGLRGEVENWACADGWADTAYFDKVWGSLEFVRVEPGFLMLLARKLGWHGDAKSDFETAPSVEEAEAAIEEAVSAHDEQEAAVALAASQLCYWPQEQKWLVRSSGEQLSHGALNMHRIGMLVAAAGKTGIQAASAKLRNSGKVQDVIGMSYYPGKDRVMQWAGGGKEGVYFNTWRPYSIPGLPGRVSDDDVKVWTDHLEWLYPNPAERRTYMQWMAYVLRNPGQKIRWAPVILGAQGLGKDLSLRPLIEGLGGLNVKEISPAILMEGWTFYYESQLVVVQEMSRQTKMEVYERIKADISGTGSDMMIVNRKHEAQYAVQNTAAYVFLTNNYDAFQITADDRRFFVLKAVPEAPREREYYERVISWYAAGGVAKVVRFLLDLDLTGFVADRPMWTDAKSDMLVASMGGFGSYVLESLEQGGKLGDRTVVATSEFTAMSRDLNVPASIRDKFHPKQVVEALRTAGWHAVSEPIRTKTGQKVRVWVKTADLAKQPGKVLTAAYARETSGGRDFSVVENA